MQFITISFLPFRLGQVHNCNCLPIHQHSSTVTTGPKVVGTGQLNKSPRSDCSYTNSVHPAACILCCHLFCIFVVFQYALIVVLRNFNFQVNLHPGEVGQPKLIRSHNGVRVSGSHGAPAESVCTALTVFLTGSVLLRRYTHGLGRSVVRTSTVYPTVPFVKSVYAVPITELDGNVRLEDGVAVLVPLARIKRTETVSVLLDCFCCVLY